VDVVDMKLNDVVKLIRGRAGSIVRLGVIPAGGGEMKTIKITRAKIELKDSEARGKIVEEGKKADGSPYKVGYIDLPSFYMDMEAARAGGAFKSTTVDVKKILEDFNSKGVDVLVLDLRKNGGGSLTEAINLTGLFIEEGPVVQVKDPDGRIQHYDDLDRDETWKGPLVVLTSKFSASASEILAGAIQDYGRGLIVGDTSTHG
jgi:carboxyl-terminal processing protease